MNPELKGEESGEEDYNENWHSSQETDTNWSGTWRGERSWGDTTLRQKNISYFKVKKMPLVCLHICMILSRTQEIETI